MNTTVLFHPFYHSRDHRNHKMSSFTLLFGDRAFFQLYQNISMHIKHECLLCFSTLSITAETIETIKCHPLPYYLRSTETFFGDRAFLQLYQNISVRIKHE